MFQYFCAVRSHQIKAVVGGAYPFTVGTVYDDTLYCHSLKQIVGIGGAVIARYQRLAESNAWVEYLARVFKDKDTLVCSNP